MGFDIKYVRNLQYKIKTIDSVIRSIKYLMIYIDIDEYLGDKKYILIKKYKLKRCIKSIDKDMMNKNNSIQELRKLDIEKNKCFIVYNHLCKYNNKVPDMILKMIILLAILLMIGLLLFIFSYNIMMQLKFNDHISWSEILSSMWSFMKDKITTLASFISVIISIIAIRNNRILNMKEQSNWRGKIYEIEQKSLNSYTLNDLFIINSFINPYFSSSSASYFVNEMIYNLYLERVEIIDLCRTEMMNILNTGFFDVDKKSYHSLFSLEEEELRPNRILSKKEALDVKLCCHILLKA